MDNRRYQRTVVDQEVECQIDGVRDFVFLYNLSVSGGMIEISNPAAGIGSIITLNLAGLTDIEGRIVWKIDRNAGIEFMHVIPEAVVQYLGFEPGPLSFAEIVPRDRYGSPLSAGL